VTVKKEKVINNIRKIREEKLLSLPEIARRTGLSTPTVKRLEDGGSCRMETKRKILEALGIELDELQKVFPTD
jgi:transcriptional regulator with XRE-family HTH domain